MHLARGVIVRIVTGLYEPKVTALFVLTAEHGFGWSLRPILGGNEIFVDRQYIRVVFPDKQRDS